MKLKIFMSWLLLVTIFSKGFSQNSRSDLQKINEKFLTCQKLSVNIIYKVYPSFSSVTPIEETNTRYLKQGNKFLSEMGEFTLLQNSKYFVAIDFSGKTIAINTPVKPEQLFGGINFDIDSLIKYGAKVKHENFSSTEKRIVIFLNEDLKDEIERFEIFYDPETFIPSKLVFYYAYAISADDEGKLPEEKPRIEIVYSNIDFNPSISEKAFSADEIFTESRGEFLAGLRFKDFQILDQRLK